MEPEPTFVNSGPAKQHFTAVITYLGKLITILQILRKWELSLFQYSKKHYRDSINRCSTFFGQNILFFSLWTGWNGLQKLSICRKYFWKSCRWQRGQSNFELSKQISLQYKKIRITVLAFIYISGGHRANKKCSEILCHCHFVYQTQCPGFLWQLIYRQSDMVSA